MAYLLFKCLHILFVVAAVGTMFSYAFWFVRLRGNPQSLPFTAKTVLWIQERVSNPSLGLLFIMGIILMLIGRIGLRAMWLQLGIALFVILAILVGAMHTRTLRRIVEMSEKTEQDAKVYEALMKRGRAEGIAINAIAIVAIFVMVTKPQIW